MRATMDIKGSIPAGEVPQAPLRVLIVDDNAINRQVLELILDHCGIAWTSVEDGRQAVNTTEHDTFAAILMDIQMPVMDGLTATREIHRRERGANRPVTPVIIVSANCEPEDVEAARAAGAQRHLAKPIDVQVLIGALYAVLPSGLQQAA
jgi:CheY-like chemotaxis protein